ncbi:MAG: FAD-binding oxidoreductase, partial [Bacteroidota bacterium]
MKILIAGAGIFGIAAALELRRRGHEVSVFDPGTLPHPLASSTDISKMIRADYGSDEFYADLMLESFEGWDEWNRSFSQPRYHEVGFLLLTKNPIQPGSFEAESMKTLAARGFPITRLSQAEIARRYPAFNSQVYQDGYFNARAGWAESGNVVAELASIAHREGVEIFENEGFARLLEEKGKVVGIVTTAGFERRADVTVVAAG